VEEEDPEAAPEENLEEAAAPEESNEGDSAGNEEIKKYEELIEALNKFHDL